MAMKSYTLLQLSDSHLSATADAELKGINTTHSLRAVAELVAADPRVYDALIATGDLSQDGSEESYRRFLALARVALAPADSTALPIRWLAGNHDAPDAMRRVEEAEQLAAVADSEQGGMGEPVVLGPWLVVMLGSRVAGEPYGELGARQLGELRGLLSQLSAAAGAASAPTLEARPMQPRYVLVCVHHNPLPTGARWMQDIGLRDGAELLSTLQQFDCARAVVHGHIHHQFERAVGRDRIDDHEFESEVIDARVDHQVERQGRGSPAVLGTPSTCVQFAPHSEDFAVDARQPGYRWFRLHADGSFETGVERVGAGSFEPETSGGGY